MQQWKLKNLLSSVVAQHRSLIKEIPATYLKSTLSNVHFCFFMTVRCSFREILQLFLSSQTTVQQLRCIPIVGVTVKKSVKKNIEKWVTKNLTQTVQTIRKTMQRSSKTGTYLALLPVLAKIIDTEANVTFTPLY